MPAGTIGSITAYAISHDTIQCPRKTIELPAGRLAMPDTISEVSPDWMTPETKQSKAHAVVCCTAPWFSDHERSSRPRERCQAYRRISLCPGNIVAANMLHVVEGESWERDHESQGH